jgi:hypothetical protein
LPWAEEAQAYSLHLDFDPEWVGLLSPGQRPG